MKKLLWMGGVAATLAGFPAPALATSITFGFNQCVGGTPQDCAIAEAQVFVDVFSTTNPHQVGFTFRNIGPDQNSLDAVYFDDGTLLGIESVVNMAGVSFSNLGVKPKNLPGGNNASPAFETTKGFSADADNPAPDWGVNPGEQLTIVFNLINGKTYANTIGALEDGGSLRIGVHVLSVGQDNGSVSLINDPQPVPEPGTLLLLGAGLTGLAASRRRRT